MKDDKRRIPYNIWINVLGGIIFLAIASVGGFAGWIALSADQRAVSGSEYKYDGWSNALVYTYSDTQTISNWQDTICRGAMWLVASVIFILGVWAWQVYATKHYWHKGYRFGGK